MRRSFGRGNTSRWCRLRRLLRAPPTIRTTCTSCGRRPARRRAAGEIATHHGPQAAPADTRGRSRRSSASSRSSWRSRCLTLGALRPLRRGARASPSRQGGPPLPEGRSGTTPAAWRIRAQGRRRRGGRGAGGSCEVQTMARPARRPKQLDPGRRHRSPLRRLARPSRADHLEGELARERRARADEADCGARAKHSRRAGTRSSTWSRRPSTSRPRQVARRGAARVTSRSGGGGEAVYRKDLEQYPEERLVPLWPLEGLRRTGRRGQGSVGPGRLRDGLGERGRRAAEFSLLSRPCVPG